jgi:dTDP-4-amino-4,6-dideoxygalactose transaminase
MSATGASCGPVATAGKRRLAILGGLPAFTDHLHVGRPNIGSRERLIGRLSEMLDRRWLTNDGPFVRMFEERVAEILGVRHAVATCSGTAALELAIHAAGLTGEVIVPSFTFVGTPHAVWSQGLTPVFCDADPRTHNIDPHRVESLITPRTTGIVGVHLWGRACDTEALGEISTRHGLHLLLDAAHAFGCSHNGEKIGGSGLAEVFSFHATKVVNCGEGGVVATNDDDIAARIRLSRNFGFADFDQVVSWGTNAKMNEFSAAMGLTSLDSMADFVSANEANYASYARGLNSIPGIKMITYDKSETPNFQYVVLEVDEAQSGLSRDALQLVLHAEHVLARRYFYPGCHRMHPYVTTASESTDWLPITERLAENVLCLPTGTAVSPDAAALVCTIVRNAVDQASDVNARLAAV